MAGNYELTQEKMPVLFVGHGSPMNAIEENEFSRAWAQLGQSLPRPRAILCISAHWETAGVQTTAMEAPRTIYDFYGFPPEMYAVRYPAPGSPGLASLVQRTVQCAAVQPDLTWGLDHGAWSVLRRMFPAADIPVVQLSLDYTKSPQEHYALGKELSSFRQRGVLIVGSGNMVHNLRMIQWGEAAFDWALEFDELLRQRILAGDHSAIIQYSQFGRLATLSIPTSEHFLPLLYALAAQEESEPVSFFAEKVTLGSISMRGVRIG
ncbi:MAG: 4,5-DOPA dioxygenase extradiol [Chloroflexi bacterium RBG_16_57_11]|nr:MAG: 4,5-DOPA dioxygenase extradiol [Chloroflexi bacterium RBG_16_57_11]